MTILICETDGTCPRHGKFIYFCSECHQEWRDANPRTTEAISRFAQGKGTLADIKKAEKKDGEQK